jgi:hypothetical protein
MGQIVFHTWKKQKVADWLRSFYDREGLEHAERTALKAKEAFVAEHFAVLHCTVCGREMRHDGRARIEWGKVRKCPECVAAKRQAGEVKFCRQCGTELRRPTPDQLPGWMDESSARKSWATRATCDICRALNDMVEGEARRFASAAKRRAQEEYFNSLSPELQRRIRHPT